MSRAWRSGPVTAHSSPSVAITPGGKLGGAAAPGAGSRTTKRGVTAAIAAAWRRSAAGGGSPSLPYFSSAPGSIDCTRSASVCPAVHAANPL